MTMIIPFNEWRDNEDTAVGGKGRVLAQLYQQGYLVPNGFVIPVEAFHNEELTPAAWSQVQAQLSQLRQSNGTRFAVRSSAVAEDGSRTSFAGEFETVLDVQSDEAVQAAIRTVHHSQQNERVAAYSAAQGISAQHKVAVVVQELVPAELSGVLFTADPITGSRTNMVGTVVRGLGDKLVSGENTGEPFQLARPYGKGSGTVLLKKFGKRLFKLAQQLEQELGWPQDIEWAIADGQVYILQSRPITTMQPHNPATGEWNHTLTGDYFWVNGNVGEAVPDVMTPLTWSMMTSYFEANSLGIETDYMPFAGNIGGRLYLNISGFLSATDAIGLPRRKMQRMIAEVFGDVPEGMNIPTVPMSRWQTLQTMLPKGWRRAKLVKGLQADVPRFVTETPKIVERLTAVIQTANTPDDLRQLWQDDLQDRLHHTMQLLASGTSDAKRLFRKLHINLEKLVGEADANTLLSGMSNESDHLASLGPLLGLTKLAQDKISYEDYLSQYGHRSPDEFELSTPRPYEDRAWVERQLTEIQRNQMDAGDLLSKQQQARQEAWQRFVQQHPRKAQKYQDLLAQMGEAAKIREKVRSEVVRMLGLLRVFALRAGELTGLGDDVFFLSWPELAVVLAGETAVLQHIPARRETYVLYKSLPPYPAVISGRFDPIAWAQDPNRRSDVYDSHVPAPPPSHGAITGFAGAAGVVNGVVRRLDRADEGHQLLPGEILVTNTTNVGWTPLFPRAAAIVTDVGAPFSHAAIVARELGIPAVVGTGNATMRLQTGDRIRVNGGAGTVECLE